MRESASVFLAVLLTVLLTQATIRANSVSQFGDVHFEAALSLFFIHMGATLDLLRWHFIDYCLRHHPTSHIVIIITWKPWQILIATYEQYFPGSHFSVLFFSFFERVS